MKLRGEEHRALQGVLPPDLAGRAVGLNVAALERGIARVVTRAHVNLLGVEALRTLVALRDPKQAAVAIARALLSRAREREPDRER